MDLDTFLTTLYVLVDDWYSGEIGAQMRRHRGAHKQMSDSEVLTVALAGQWQAGTVWRSERSLVRWMQDHGRGWFPQMLGRSEFNERVRKLWGALVRLQQIVSEQLSSAQDAYESVDCVPVRHCSLSQAASTDGHWCWWGSLGHGGNDGGWYWGDQCLLSVSPSGVVSGWLLGPANMDDRWMLQVFLSARHGQAQWVGPSGRPIPQRLGTFGPLATVGLAPGLPYLADAGFNGLAWFSHWLHSYAACVLAAPPDNTPLAWSPPQKRSLASHRQIVETVFARLASTFGFQRLNAHSRWGQITRLAAKLAAYNIGLFINRSIQRPDGALASLLV